MHGAARGAWRQRLDAGQDCRWHEQQHDREEDDVPAGRSSRSEELTVLAEQVEQRLRNREGPEDEQVKGGDAQPHGQARGRAR